MISVLAYIPVVHTGYLEFFNEYLAADNSQQHKKILYLIPPELGKEFGPTHKDLHGLDVEVIKKFIETLQIFDQVEIVNFENAAQLNSSENTLYIPSEVISKQFVQKYLPQCKVTASGIFLRWDKENALQNSEPQTAEPMQKSELLAQIPENVGEFLKTAHAEGSQSSDWWRQVGAVAVRGLPDGKTTIIAQAHNTHLPSEQQPYVEGDGRAQFHKGMEIDKTTAIHAEAKLIAEAAKTGISLLGADLYVTDFPCPTCAKLIATAGFTRVFYEKGYAVFDGERVLKAAGVMICKI